ncbi:hypothetical protein IWW56_001287 [Coemansia sp. RSA 2131]|nr:hypothetical protein IWW56_001287 [Coemansia sp. RSA 2131]
MNQLSDEQQQAQLHGWTQKLTSLYISQDMSEVDYMQLKERDPKLELQVLPEDAHAEKDTPWLFVVAGKKFVKPSLLPFDGSRHIRPGRPITRDLCQDRINLYSKDDGKITKIAFF